MPRQKPASKMTRSGRSFIALTSCVCLLYLAQPIVSTVTASQSQVTHHHHQQQQQQQQQQQSAQTNHDLARQRELVMALDQLMRSAQVDRLELAADQANIRKALELSDNQVYLVQPNSGQQSADDQAVAINKLKYSLSEQDGKQTDFSGEIYPPNLVYELPGAEVASDWNSLELVGPMRGDQPIAVNRPTGNLQLINKNGLIEGYMSTNTGRGDEKQPQPVLDRWSSWHDMSVDPDLAAVDDQAVVSVVAPPTDSATYLRQSYENRLDGRDMSSRGSSISHQYTGSSGKTSSGKAPRWLLAPSRTQQPARSQFQIKGVQQHQQQQQVHLTGHRGAATSGQIKGGTKLPLNLISPSGRLIKMQHHSSSANVVGEQQQVGQVLQDGLATSSGQASGGNAAKQQQQQQQVVEPLLSSRPNTTTTTITKISSSPANSQPRRKAKRRRKHPSPASASTSTIKYPNTEVRIRQLVLADQQRLSNQHLEQSTSSVERAQQRPLPTTGVQVHYQQQQMQLQQLNQASQALPMIKQQTGDVAPVRKPVAARRTPQLMAGKRPPVIIKRLGGAGSPTVIGQRPRVQRRRRLKTLLPVGLSSWFLGGIRDLDGRHWQLPPDLMSKLQVNDVDLGGPARPKMVPPSAGSVEIISPSSSPSSSPSNQRSEPNKVVAAVIR